MKFIEKLKLCWTILRLDKHPARYRSSSIGPIDEHPILQHAKRELNILLDTSEITKFEYDMLMLSTRVMIQTTIYGDGDSYTGNIHSLYIMKIMNLEVICPITNNKNEWVREDSIWRNIRNRSIYKYSNMQAFVEGGYVLYAPDGKRLKIDKPVSLPTLLIKPEYISKSDSRYDSILPTAMCENPYGETNCKN